MAVHINKTRLYFACLALLLFSTSGCQALPGLSAAIPSLEPQNEQINARLAAEAVLFPSATPLPPTTTLPSTETPTSPPPAPSVPTFTATPAYAFGPDHFPTGINPLTGLEVANPGILERRPILVKVTNFPRSVRPQYGLSLADHVYEYYIADEMTRFMGIFYGQDAMRVGPVRSARLFDEHVMRMYGAVFAFGWADDPVLERLLVDDLRRLLLVEDGTNCPPLCRIGPEYAYNTLFLDTSQVNAYLDWRRSDNNAPSLEGLRFAAGLPLSGHSATQIFTRFSAVSYHRWDYEASSGHYLRFQESGYEGGSEEGYIPLTDNLTGQQLATDNLVFLLVPHEYFHKSSSTEIFDQIILGSGQGYALRDGNLYPIRWTQSAPDQLITLKLPDGRSYPLKPGNIWFEILSVQSELSSPLEGLWHFNFTLPEPVPTATPTSTATPTRPVKKQG